MLRSSPENQSQAGDMDALSRRCDLPEALESFAETVGAYRNLASKRADRAHVREYIRTVLEMEPDAELSKRGSNVLAEIMGRFDSSARVVSDLLDSHRANEERARASESNLLESILSGFDGAGIGQTSAGSLQTGGTWFNAYNSVTEFLTHSAGRTEDTREESLLFGEGRTRNATALRLAMAA